MLPRLPLARPAQWLLLLGYGLLAALAAVLLMLATQKAPANHVAPTQYSQMLWAVAAGLRAVPRSAGLADGGRHRDHPRRRPVHLRARGPGHPLVETSPTGLSSPRLAISDHTADLSRPVGPALSPDLRRCSDCHASACSGPRKSRRRATTAPRTFRG